MRVEPVSNIEDDSDSEDDILKFRDVAKAEIISMLPRDYSYKKKKEKGLVIITTQHRK